MTKLMTAGFESCLISTQQMVCLHQRSEFDRSEWNSEYTFCCVEQGGTWNIHPIVSRHPYVIPSIQGRTCQRKIRDNEASRDRDIASSSWTRKTSWVRYTRVVKVKTFKILTERWNGQYTRSPSLSFVSKGLWGKFKRSVRNRIIYQAALLCRRERGDLPGLCLLKKGTNENRCLSLLFSALLTGHQPQLFRDRFDGCYCLDGGAWYTDQPVWATPPCHRNPTDGQTRVGHAYSAPKYHWWKTKIEACAIKVLRAGIYQEQ